MNLLRSLIALLVCFLQCNSCLSVAHLNEKKLHAKSNGLSHDVGTALIDRKDHRVQCSITNYSNLRLLLNKGHVKTFSSAKLATLKSLKVLRGGAVPSSFNLVLAETFIKFINYVGETKARCFAILFISILAENWATALSKKAKDGGSVTLFGAACILYLVCMGGFNISLAQIDMAIAYAIWSAVGTLVVTASGVIFFGEPISVAKILCLSMVVMGVVGLNFLDEH